METKPATTLSDEHPDAVDAAKAEGVEALEPDLDAEDEFEDHDPAPGGRDIECDPETVGAKGVSRLPKNLSPSQARSFRAALRVDLLRPAASRLGYQALYEAYARHGDRHWLDPSRALRPFTEILFRMRGPARALSPFLGIFVKLALAGFCPAPFIRYVFIARLGGDWDFRHWERRHRAAIESLADAALEIAASPSFRHPSMDLGDRRLIRDVFVCKYILLPAASWDARALAKGRLAPVGAAWESMPLAHPGLIAFMRRNFLPICRFLRRSASPENLVDLVRNLEGCARAFPLLDAPPEPEEEDEEPRLFDLIYNMMNPPRQPSPAEEAYRLKVRRELLNGIRIWGKEPLQYLHERQAFGAKAHELVSEYRGILSLIAAALACPAAFHSLAWILARLRLKHREAVAGDLAEAVLLLGPHVRMGMLRWHWDSLEKTPSKDRVHFLAQMRGAGGKHPNAPKPHRWIHRGFGAPVKEETIRGSLLGLGVPEVKVDRFIHGLCPPKKRPAENRPRGPWPAHTLRAPQAKELLELVRPFAPDAAASAQRLLEDLGTGADGAWEESTYAHLDRWQALLPIFLKRAVAGLGAFWAGLFLGKNAWDFMMSEGRLRPSLVSLMGSKPLHSIPFGLEMKPLGDELLAAKVRPRVVLAGAARFATHFLAGPRQVGEALAFLLEQRNALFASLRAREKETPRGKNEGVGPEIPRALEAMRRKLEEYDALLSSAGRLAEPDRWLTAFLALTQRSGEQEAGSAIAVGLLLARYGKEPAISGPLSELAADVVPSELDGASLEALEAFARRLFAFARDDETITARFEKEGATPAWVGALRPFLIPKKKRLGMEAWDAALRRAAGLTRLAGTLADWREAEERIVRAAEVEAWKVVVSRAPLDAFYGHMGGICLSGAPGVLTRNEVLVLRLADPDGRIQGMTLAARCRVGLGQGSAQPALRVMAVNPLPSVLSKLSHRRQMIVWAAFRAALEGICRKEGRVAYLCTDHGILTDCGAFGKCVLELEHRLGATPGTLSDGFALQGSGYGPSSFSSVMKIIDPARPESFFGARVLAEIEKQRK